MREVLLFLLAGGEGFGYKVNIGWRQEGWELCATVSRSSFALSLLNTTGWPEREGRLHPASILCALLCCSWHGNILGSPRVPPRLRAPAGGSREVRLMLCSECRGFLLEAALKVPLLSPGAILANSSFICKKKRWDLKRLLTLLLHISFKFPCLPWGCSTSPALEEFWKCFWGQSHATSTDC